VGGGVAVRSDCATGQVFGSPLLRSSSCLIFFALIDEFCVSGADGSFSTGGAFRFRGAEFPTAGAALVSMCFSLRRVTILA